MIVTPLAAAVAQELATDTVRTIRLYGRLGAKFGRVHRLAVKSAAEAIRALCALYQGFEPYLTQAKDRGEGYAVFYGEQNLREEELHNPMGAAEIRIAPMILGAKRAGVFQIIVGVVLIAIGAVLNFTPFAAASPFFYKMGAAMIIGGIVQLLTPVPKGRAAEDRPDNRSSAIFNGPINTQAQGNPVQVLYGELIDGSAVISAGISAEDQAYIPRQRLRIGSGGGGGGGTPTWNNNWV